MNTPPSPSSTTPDDDATQKKTLLIPRDPSVYPVVHFLGPALANVLISQSPDGPHSWYIPLQENYNSDKTPASAIEELLITKLHTAIRPRLLHLLRDPRHQLTPRLGEYHAAQKASPKRKTPPPPYDGPGPRPPTPVAKALSALKYREEALAHEKELRGKRRFLFSYLKQLHTQAAHKLRLNSAAVADEVEDTLPLITNCQDFDADRPRTPLVTEAYRDALLRERWNRTRTRTSTRKKLEAPVTSTLFPIFDQSQWQLETYSPLTRD